MIAKSKDPLINSEINFEKLADNRIKWSPKGRPWEHAYLTQEEFDRLFVPVAETSTTP